MTIAEGVLDAHVILARTGARQLLALSVILIAQHLRVMTGNHANDIALQAVLVHLDMPTRVIISRTLKGFCFLF